MFSGKTSLSIKALLAPLYKPSVIVSFHSETTIPNRKFFALGIVALSYSDKFLFSVAMCFSEKSGNLFVSQGLRFTNKHINVFSFGRRRIIFFNIVEVS